ncbi:hypothetical protein AAF712_012860 [Marasmius tenuissimus]|uniref:Uncharacterized protein n=1 Tax=Marasmius tenuissimus TaxID=585030 RepID=A0ABR2ZG95_9AGAR
MSPSNQSFDPFVDSDDSDDLNLKRCTSPTSSIRGCYVRSRPTSFLNDDDGGEMQNQLLNFSVLADADAPPPPYSRRPTRSRYELDSVSVITTRTTVSTFRAVRNRDACPPMLRRSERGKKFSSSMGDLLAGNDMHTLGALEEESEKKERGWKGGRRLKERFSLLFSGRKESAGILDREHLVVGSGEGEKGQIKKKKKKLSISALAEGTASSVEAIPLETIPARSRKVFRRRGSKMRRVGGGGADVEMQRGGGVTVRHSKSFSGFRGSVINSATIPDVPPVPELPQNEAVKEEQCDDEEDEYIDEITREAAKVNDSVRRTYSYEEDPVDEEED